MADSKISALPSATTPLAGTEVLPIVQSGVTDQVTVANLTAGRAISATQLTLSTGNLIVGASGSGVSFSGVTPPAGMISQLLADYEQGTWTPTDGSGAGLTFSTALGWYLKIGKQVTVTCRVVYPTTASTANAVISGLPFTSQTASLYIPTGILSNGGGTSAAYASIASNVAVIRLFNASTSVAITNVGFSTATVGFSLSYITA